MRERVTEVLRSIDPRLFQIATLAFLLVLGLTRYELDAGLPQIAMMILGCLAAQAIAARIQGVAFDWRSPLITGLSLSLLLRTHQPLLWIAAAVLAIGSKFVLRLGRKHLFNPACFAIVTLLLTTHGVWVLPGQWGAFAWGVAAIASAAALVLGPTRRIDVAVAFLIGWGLLLAGRCQWLGDPWTIPLHQVQSGALLVFSCFMITDPRTTPDSRAGRIVFALAVAVVGHWFQFYAQVREGLFYALLLVSVSTPLLDIVLPDRKFGWSAPLPLEV